LGKAMNVLIFKLSPIGDTVMFLPVVQELRRLRPGWHITVCTTPACAGLFRPTIGESDIWTAELEQFRRAWRRPASLLPWVMRVRRLRPDAVLLSFDQSSVARMLAILSGAPIRIGGAQSAVNWRRGLTREVPIGPGQSLAHWEWEMARDLPLGPGSGWPEIPPPPCLPIAARLPRGDRPRIVIHAGASRAYQLWPIERFMRLAGRLAVDFDVTWVREPGGVRATPGPPVATTETPGILEFAALAGASDLFVGNHSGPFHLACAAGTPCVVVTGPTLPVCDPPWSAGRATFLRMPGLACMPCDRLIVSPNKCTNLQTPMACMDYWSVEAVDRVCRNVLAERGAP
jgi:ADP-heptose:LPS heptosyltransferase